ncbi:flagellar motor switch protein FliN [Thiospirochaeta perfilievii]|uniref:Flagellar motor switch protein FliN n=2 Tax=Thiospirochaeta perfilievii TaxID=252967 RepID=A0A5C1QH44_9SPIO|nr:flagellar motor switch protein FliN [Thiospirochaeta perfilievii]
MSDGSLSQDEIDALLFQGGSDSLDDSSTPNITEADKDNVLSLIDKTKESISNTLSGMLGKSVKLSLGSADITNKSSLLSKLPDEMVEIKLDYSGEAPGEHLYITEKDDALKIAGLMSGQDGLELDAMALASIGEAISQITGTLLTSIEREAKKNVSPSAPEAQKVPKAMVRFPDGDFVSIELILNIEGDGTVKFYEIFDSSIVTALNFLPQDIPQAPSYMGNQQQQPQQQQQQQQQPMNMGQNQQMNMGMGQNQQMNMGQNQQNQMGMGQNPQMMGGGMYQQPMYQQQNVQGVQYPNLNQVDLSGIDSRNIGLLMDVSMELTVELGRTKWQIKEILGIGEGTIIELDKLAGEPVDILVNKNLIARGEVVVIDENFGVRVTEIVSAGAKSVEN